MDNLLTLCNASLVDGTGGPSRSVDIEIEAGIVSGIRPIGDFPGPSEQCIDIKGATVTPGFIDVHSHADNAPFLPFDDVSKIQQGVTTEVVGNCGFSLAPIMASRRELFVRYMQRLLPKDTPWHWHTFSELLKATDERGYVTNVVPLVGHHALRIAAMGLENRPPSSSEQRQMHSLLSRAIDAGAFGLSTGLIYPPGTYSSSTEITDLVHSLPDYAVYATHMRGEGKGLWQSLEEAIAVAESTRKYVQVSHLKVADRSEWGTMEKALNLLDEARRRGAAMRHDVYPYTAASTMLAALLPPAYQEGGDDALLARLRSRSVIEQLEDSFIAAANDWENWIAAAGWDRIRIASSVSGIYDGLSIGEISRSDNVRPLEALVDILVEEELGVSMIVEVMDEGDVALALSHPLTMVGSDGLPPGTGGKPHPRMYGTFPRMLGNYVRERRIISLEEAVYRMTGLPASTFGMRDRGLVDIGKVADLVVLSQEEIIDTATYENPTGSPRGIDMVFQRGNLVVQDGKYLGGRHGRRLQPAL